MTETTDIMRLQREKAEGEHMNTLVQIEQAVTTLKNDDFRKLYHWMRELDHQKWDQQIKEDSDNSVLDHLANQAICEYRQGRTKRL